MHTVLFNKLFFDFHFIFTYKTKNSIKNVFDAV
jgi:hypothetical protein